MNFSINIHRNALYTVYFALYGEPNIEGAYKAQSIFLYSGIPKPVQMYNELSDELERITLEYNQCSLSTTYSSELWLEALDDNIVTLKQQIHKHKLHFQL